MRAISGTWSGARGGRAALAQCRASQEKAGTAALVAGIADQDEADPGFVGEAGERVQAVRVERVGFVDEYEGGPRELEAPVRQVPDESVDAAGAFDGAVVGTKRVAAGAAGDDVGARAREGAGRGGEGGFPGSIRREGDHVQTTAGEHGPGRGGGIGSEGAQVAFTHALGRKGGMREVRVKARGEPRDLLLRGIGLRGGVLRLLVGGVVPEQRHDVRVGEHVLGGAIELRPGEGFAPEDAAHVVARERAAPGAEAREDTVRELGGELLCDRFGGSGAKGAHELA